MRRRNPTQWQHSHNYAVDTSVAKRRTCIVIGNTGRMMVVEEIGTVIVFGSMALVAVRPGCGFLCHGRFESSRTG